jgi:hypothetical protein
MRTLLAIPVLCSLAIAQGWVDKTPANPNLRPSNRAFPAMCWDAARGYVLMFGGYNTQLGPSNQTWTWNGTTWSFQNVANPPYVGSVGGLLPAQMAAAFHPPTSEVLLVIATETYAWNGTSWFHQPGSLNSASGMPCNLAVAHDATRNQTVLFVGGRFNGTMTVTSETYLRAGSVWSPLSPATQPHLVDNPSMAFDPVSNKLVLCTTGNGQTAFFEWNGSNWQQRLIAGGPAGGGSLACDSANGRIVLFDGVMSAQPNHTWTLRNGAITQLTTPVEPARRFGAGMAFDPIRNRTVLFGGTSTFPAPGYLALGDLWEFELPAGASFTSYGAGCAGSRGVPNIAAASGALPRVGQTFQATITNLPLQGLAFVFLGLSNTSYGPTPLPLSLNFLGGTGCSVLASGDDLGLVVNVLGTGLWQWTVPNAPGASFYTQAFAFDALANPLGITTSNGAHGVIGF